MKKTKTGNGPQKKASSLPCVHAHECSGCPLIIHPYPKQLEIKRAKIKEAFLGAGFTKKQVDVWIKPVRPAIQTFGYRNKAKWIFQEDPENGLRMGIYRAGTHEVVDIPKCVVHAPLINEVSVWIKQALINHRVPCGSEHMPRACLRYMIVRYSFRDKKALVVFVTSDPKVPGLQAVVDQLKLQWSEKVVTIVQNINTEDTDVLLGESNRFLFRGSELTEQMGKFRVPVGPLSFLQVNSRQAAVLYGLVEKALGRGPFKAGLDLYSGVGLHALHAAKKTENILAVEEVAPAALEGNMAARRNRIGNIYQVCADATEGIGSFYAEWGTPDWVVINPPRKGCDKKVLDMLASRPPTKWVYVSCSPATLARDLQILVRSLPALRIKSIEPVDMFPQTAHVECVADLEMIPDIERTKRRQMMS